MGEGGRGGGGRGYYCPGNIRVAKRTLTASAASLNSLELEKRKFAGKAQ